MKEAQLEYTAMGTIKPHSIKEAARYITENTALNVIAEHYGENIAKLKQYHIENLKDAYTREQVQKFTAEEVACYDAEKLLVDSGEVTPENCEFWGDKEELIVFNTQMNNRRTLKTRLRLINKVYCTNLIGAYFNTNELNLKP